MKILAVLLVKNEADIIRSTLEDARRWASRIFVLDNGSTDGTWDILKSLQGDVIVPWRQEFAPYRRSFRAELFNQFRGEARRGDWWCNMDSDEFYIDDPREFLARVPRSAQVVFKKSIDYRLTREDLRDHEFTGRFDEDQPYLRYVDPTCWAETRFFRHRDRLRWQATGPGASDLPRHLGLHYPLPILARHYQFRSPRQIQGRLDVRNAIPKDQTGAPFRHIRHTRWEETVPSRNDLVLDLGPATWAALPLRTRIREKPSRRLAKRLMSGTGLWP
jgi:glycosyltransferase involved in cell wall biosynthesis